jgi:Rrf2 family protein
MFRLSKAAKYSIQGVLYLAGRAEGEVAGIEAIARATDLPAAYLAKLFQELGKHGLVRSVRGPEGGFSLTRDPSGISVLEVIEAIEGPVFTGECLIHEGNCPMDEACPVLGMWSEAQECFLKRLRGCSFTDLARDLTRESSGGRPASSKPPQAKGRRGAAN